MTNLDRADIQGDILEAYGNKYVHTSYVFITVGDAGEGRAWLAERIGAVTTAERWRGHRPSWTFNLALTYSGLLALGVPAAAAASFSDEFTQGMGQRAVELGDVGRNAPSAWEAGLGTGDAHILVTINALGDGARDEAVGQLR